MTLDLHADALLNATGGTAFIVVAVLLLVSRGNARRRLLLAWACGAFGAAFVFQNLLVPDSAGAIVATDAAFVLSAATGALLAADLARAASPRGRAVLATLGLVGAVVFALQFFAPGREAIGLAFHAPPSLALIEGYAVGISNGPNIAFGLVVAAAALARDRGRSHAILATTLGAFGMFNGPAQAIFPLYERADVLTYLAVPYAGSLLWVPWRDARPRARFSAPYFLLGLGALGAIFNAFVQARGGTLFDDYGVYGALRMAMAGVLAAAILRGRMFGIEPPHFMISRGPLAASALALLFIVAQIAQNFLAAEYGLLMGGIVAGAFLFAAAPLQRAMERVREGPPTAGGRAPSAALLENEDAYRRALRIALRDRVITTDEEIHLADLGERLGIRAGRARELRHDIERELGGAR